MFEVCFEAKTGNSERHVAKQFWMAQAIARRAVLDKAKKVVVRRVRTDIWIADSTTGELYRVCKAMPADRAARWARDWAAVDNQDGCLLWPSRSKIPLHLAVIS